jgi:hypothetical protein
MTEKGMLGCRKALLRGKNDESKTCFDSGETWQDAFNGEFHYGLCDLDVEGSSKERRTWLYKKGLVARRRIIQ